MPELKPCPFCNSPDAIETVNNGNYTVTCTSCLSSAGNYDSELAARIAWNERPINDHSLELLREGLKEDRLSRE